MIKLRFVRIHCMLVVLTAIAMGAGMRPVLAAGETASVPEEDVQVLTSGPIHEAFAETVAFDPEPGIVAPKAPPVAIEEIPPEQKPEGDIQWIPGYWAWDDERDDFIWVSGFWRVPPPDRQWIPGYWTSVGQGFQWISGYWANAKVNVAEYLPEPPESVEVGPSTNAPSPDHCWIPGCWIWSHGRYAWRPGYWANMSPDWTWVPAHYVWTPRGYIFVGGYWDYAVVHRGVLFAPVFFPQRVYMGAAFSFSPGFVIDLGVFSDCLFLRLGYSHYYFGDYYAPRYYTRGIYPWFSLHARRLGYDPIYAHQRWKNRHDHGWENRLQTRFQERRDHEKAQPPRMLDHRIGTNTTAGGKAGAKRQVRAVPLERMAKDKDTLSRFQPLNEKERRTFTQREKDVRTYGKERQIRETRKPDKVIVKTSKKTGPEKIKFSRSPITAKPADRSDRKKPRQIDIRRRSRTPMLSLCEGKTMYRVCGTMVSVRKI